MKKIQKPKNSSELSLDETMDQFAIELAQELRSKDVPRDERITGFGRLVIYWSLKHKLPPPPDDSKGAFGGFRDKISGLGNGSGRSAAKPSNGADTSPDF